MRLFKAMSRAGDVQGRGCGPVLGCLSSKYKVLSLPLSTPYIPLSPFSECVQTYSKYFKAYETVQWPLWINILLSSVYQK